MSDLQYPIADIADRCILPAGFDLLPVADRVYVAFAVHPPRRGLVSLAIAHFDVDRRKYVVDVARQDMAHAAAVCLLDRYDVEAVKGAESDSYDVTASVEAVAGVFAFLRERHHKAVPV